MMFNNATVAQALFVVCSYLLAAHVWLLDSWMKPYLVCEPNLVIWIDAVLLFFVARFILEQKYQSKNRLPVTFVK